MDWVSLHPEILTSIKLSKKIFSVKNLDHENLDLSLQRGRLGRDEVELSHFIPNTCTSKNVFCASERLFQKKEFTWMIIVFKLTGQKSPRKQRFNLTKTSFEISTFFLCNLLRESVFIVLSFFLESVKSLLICQQLIREFMCNTLSEMLLQTNKITVLLLKLKFFSG